MTSETRINAGFIEPAATAAAIGDQIGWHTFRHSYRRWLDATNAPIGMQKELMRHSDNATTMNVYGRAMNQGSAMQIRRW